MAELYARGLFDPSGVNSSPDATGQLDGSALPSPGDNGSVLVDTKLGRISNAVAARVFYTSSTEIVSAFDNTDGSGYSFTSLNNAIASFPSDCWRLNALGYAQALFLDVYPAYSEFDPQDSTGQSDVLGDINAVAPIVFYWHGGGFDVGYANNRDGLLEVVLQFCRIGFHVVVPEYRRGWVPIAKNSDDNFDQIGVSAWLNTDLETGLSGFDLAPTGGPTSANGYNSGNGFPSKSNDFFEDTAKGVTGLAIRDSMDACTWVLSNIGDVLPNAVTRFIMWGNSAGGSIATQLAFCPGNSSQVSSETALMNQWKTINRRIMAAAPNFGTCGSDFVYGVDVSGWTHQPVAVFNFQGGDQLSPIRDSHIFWQDQMFVTRGTFDLWKDLDDKSYNVIGFCDITGGHGYGAFSIDKASVNSGGVPDFVNLEHIDYLVQFLTQCRLGTQPPNHLVFKLFEEPGKGGTYRNLNKALSYPFGRYFITLSAGNAQKMYNPNGGKSSVDPNLYAIQTDTLGNATLGFYVPSGETEGWGAYWFGDSVSPNPSSYFDVTPSTGDIGVYSHEGRAEVIVDDEFPGEDIDLFNISYYSNYDTRESPAP